MSPPTPPSPPIISRSGRDEDEQRATSRGHHRTARDYRASRSRSRGRGRSNRLSPERRQRQRTHSRSRSRDNTSRYRRRPRTERSPSRHRRERSLSRHRRDRSLSKHRRERSLSRHRRERSPSTSRVRRRRSSHRSRSRSYSKTTYKSSHRSKSRTRSHSRSRQRHHRSRSGSKSLQIRDPRSRAESSTKQQANVIVLSTESYKDSLKSSSKLPSIKEGPSNSSSSSTNSKQSSSTEETPSWKRAKVDQIGVYSNLEPDAPIDKEKIHREIEEKLRLALAREGKVYPYPKPEPSHPVFANDGSFLEIFKKMQQQQTFVQQQVGESMQIHALPTAPVAPVKPVVPIHHPPPPQLPVFGRRRGGKILKTGVVAKPQASNDSESGDVKDFWSIYLREVKKYKSTACESESKTRPLVR